MKIIGKEHLKKIKMSHPIPTLEYHEHNERSSPREKAIQRHIKKTEKVSKAKVRHKKGKGIVGPGGKSEAYYDKDSRQIKFK